MGEKKAKQPDWLLTEEWGINRDTYNWTLVYRPHDAKSDKWHAKAYYGKITQLIDGLYDHIGRNIEAEADLKDHVTKCASDVSHAAIRLAAYLEGRLEKLDENAPANMFRPNGLRLNRNFERIAKATGLELEMVNVGSQPGDGTGDSLRAAWEKANRNFIKLDEFLKPERDES